jgi:hypothetical protein
MRFNYWGRNGKIIGAKPTHRGANSLSLYTIIFLSAFWQFQSAASESEPCAAATVAENENGNGAEREERNARAVVLITSQINIRGAITGVCLRYGFVRASERVGRKCRGALIRSI